jgi:hypothetical protein
LAEVTETELTEPEPEFKVVQTGNEGVPELYWYAVSVVLNITSPVAGSTIASLLVLVILGKSKPLVVLLTSRMALVSAVAPVALIDTF